MNAQLETANNEVKAQRHNPRFRFTAILSVAGETKEVIFAMQPSGSVMAIVRGGLATVGRDVIEAFKYLNRIELQTQKAKLLKEISEWAAKPMYIRAQFSDALDARLNRIDSFLSVA